MFYLFNLQINSGHLHGKTDFGVAQENPFSFFKNYSSAYALKNHGDEFLSTDEFVSNKDRLPICTSSLSFEKQANSTPVLKSMARGLVCQPESPDDEEITETNIVNFNLKGVQPGLYLVKMDNLEQLFYVDNKSLQLPFAFIEIIINKGEQPVHNYQVKFKKNN